MTRVWIALGILAAIISLAFAQLNLANNTSEDIMEILDKIEISAKSQSDETVKLCGEMEEIWNTKRSFLAMFLSHEEIDKIDIAIENLIRMSQQKQYDAFYIECGVLLCYIQSLEENERISIHNLL